MATSATQPAAPQPPATGSGGTLKLILIAIVAVLLALTIAGGAAYYFLVLKAGPKTALSKTASVQLPPIYFALDPFTVNLQSDDGEHYLHVGLTLEFTDPKTADQLKERMPEIRSRILMLLANKHPADLATPDGKTTLIKELKAQIEQPFTPGTDSTSINEVLFTDFVVQ